MIVIPTGYGMKGCATPTPDERLQAYARALGGHYDPNSHARRAAAGLAILKRLRAIWRKRVAKKSPRKKSRAITTNVVPMRRRA